MCISNEHIQGTVHLMEGTVHLMEGTVHLMEGTVHLMEGTVHLMEGTVHLMEGTVHLMEGKFLHVCLHTYEYALCIRHIHLCSKYHTHNMPTCGMTQRDWLASIMCGLAGIHNVWAGRPMALGWKTKWHWAGLMAIGTQC